MDSYIKGDNDQTMQTYGRIPYKILIWCPTGSPPDSFLTRLN